MLPGISLCIISKNNDNCIAESIGSVRHIVSQIVLALDDRTTDSTGTIAQSLGAEVHPFKFEHFGQARDFSLSLAQHEWILVLDADETLTHEHADIVKTTVQNTHHDAFQFPRRNWKDVGMTELAVFPFTGAPIPYPDFQVRLFKNVPYIKYGNQSVHESPRGIRSLATIPDGVHINHFQFVYKSLERAQESFILYEALKAKSK